MKASDYLLVGQGLAGTSLAFHLMELGQTVCVLDDHRKESSSQVAAGLFNPVTGRKMVKTWMADELFPCLIDFYRRTEKLTGRSYLHEVPIYRPFHSAEEQNEWMGKSSDPEFSSFIKEVYLREAVDGVKDPFGGIMLASSGYLDIPEYLRGMKAYFEECGVFSRQTLDVNKLKKNKGHIVYDGREFGKLIFCDGTSAVSNTFFSWLPFRPVKGELLEVRLETTFPAIINRGVFLVEIGDKLFRVGSTYDHQDLTWEGTDEGREHLLERLSNLIDFTPEVTKQYAGVRPATADRKPIMGFHPEDETIGVFNGLGTKGVSLSPWFGSHFARHLCKGEELLPDVNISRYFSLY